MGILWYVCNKFSSCLTQRKPPMVNPSCVQVKWTSEKINDCTGNTNPSFQLKQQRLKTMVWSRCSSLLVGWSSAPTGLGVFTNQDHLIYFKSILVIILSSDLSQHLRSALTRFCSSVSHHLHRVDVTSVKHKQKAGTNAKLWIIPALLCYNQQGAALNWKTESGS